MNLESSKTKLIWSITQAALQNDGVHKLADKIKHNYIDALRFHFSEEMTPLIQNLRQEIINQLKSSRPQPNPEGYIPFLFSLVGRRAIIATPQGKSLKIVDNAEVVVHFIHNFKCFVEGITAHDDKRDRIEIFVSAKEQLAHLANGSKLIISYGDASLVIKHIDSKNENEVKATCRVEYGGTVINHMEIHSPSLSRSIFPLIPEDAQSLKLNFNNLADYVIIHGAETIEEFIQLKDMIVGKDTSTSLRHPTVPINNQIRSPDTDVCPKLIFKIDSKKSMNMYPQIIKYVDGVFLSRSELGLDEHPHNLALIQKSIINQSNEKGKFVVIASELMYSMRVNPNPTRAEVSDMANAVGDGTDALMLSVEVTEGPHSEEVAKVSKETLLNAEKFLAERWKYTHAELSSVDDAVSFGALRLAELSKAKAIVCLTEGGYTAMKLSAFRTPIDIVAFTYNKKIMRQMNMLWAVTAMILEPDLPTEKILAQIKTLLSKHLGYKTGDKFVFVSLTSSSVSERNSNIFSLQTIE